jgi:hypothetical protein
MTLYFSDGHSPTFGNQLPGGLGDQGDIWMVTRTSVNGAWGEPVNLGPGINSQHAIHPSISSDGLSLYFQSHRSGALGHCDIMVATRNSTTDPFEGPVFIRKVNTGGPEWTPDISADGLTLFFMRNPGPTEIWASTRQTTGDEFGTPIKLPRQVNMSGYDNGIPNISDDGSTLYFLSSRPGGFGGWDLWQVSITPIVDFNGDGIVDSADMCIMVDHWGEDYSLCDIAPLPFGDNIVDVQDLIILSEHLFEEILPSELVAYWRLDESEGDIAYDSAGQRNSLLFGDPVWMPDGGKMSGALEFDGIDDHVIADFVLNPADGAFSAFAWIKGGAPGQAIVSQADGTGTGQIWLGTDPLYGKLMTGLTPVTGRSPSIPLISEYIITDGQWHHIGIVIAAYQSMQFRYLYLDGVRIVTDTQSVELPFSNGGMYFGAGKELDAASFFSGLIDDVRIYDVALSADEIEVLAQ